jgi:hypothetical protein
VVEQISLTFPPLLYVDGSTYLRKRGTQSAGTGYLFQLDRKAHRLSDSLSAKALLLAWSVIDSTVNDISQRLASCMICRDTPRDELTMCSVREGNNRYNHYRTHVMSEAVSVKEATEFARSASVDCQLDCSVWLQGTRGRRLGRTRMDWSLPGSAPHSARAGGACAFLGCFALPSVGLSIRIWCVSWSGAGEQLPLWLFHPSIIGDSKQFTWTQPQFIQDILLCGIEPLRPGQRHGQAIMRAYCGLWKGTHTLLSWSTALCVNLSGACSAAVVGAR